MRDYNNGILFGQQVNPRTNSNLLLNQDTTYRIQLDINCNLFDRDSLGIVGSGKLKNQGSSFPQNGRRNKFQDNIKWDIAVKDSFNYIHFTNTYYRPNNPSSTLLFGLVVLNNTQNISYRPNAPVPSNPSPCSNGLQVNKLADGSKLANSFKVILFPNPVDEILNIQFTDTPQSMVNLQLFNSIGQNLQTLELKNKENNLHLQNYPSGIYFLKLSHTHPNFFQIRTKSLYCPLLILGFTNET